jgi:O-antigen/teichoic acid export membrane protein
MALNAIDHPAEVTARPLKAKIFRRFLIAVFGLIGARLAGAAFGFLSQLLLARSFPAAEVGIVFLAMSITAFLGFLITCGYHNIALTYLARYRAFGRPGLVEAFLGVARRDMVRVALLVLVGAVLAYFFAPAPPETAKAILFGSLAAIPLAAIRLNNSVANSQRRFLLSYAPDFVGRTGLLTLFIAVLLLFPGRNIDTVLIALVAIAVVVAVAQAVLLGTDNAWTWPRDGATRDLAPFLRHRAGAMLFVSIISGASADLVVMLGGLFLPAADVAVLGVAVRLAALVGFLSSASQPFILRDLAGAISRSASAEINTLLLRMNLAGLAIMAAAILVSALFGGFILRIYGEHYVAGYWPLLIFLFGQGLRTASGLNSGLLSLGGHQLKSAGLCACAVLVLVVLGALLAPRWGVLGLAVASVGSEAFWAVGLAYLTQKLEGRRGDIVGLLARR